MIFSSSFSCEGSLTRFNPGFDVTIFCRSNVVIDTDIKNDILIRDQLYFQLIFTAWVLCRSMSSQVADFCTVVGHWNQRFIISIWDLNFPSSLFRPTNIKKRWSTFTWSHSHLIYYLPISCMLQYISIKLYICYAISQKLVAVSINLKKVRLQMGCQWFSYLSLLIFNSLKIKANELSLIFTVSRSSQDYCQLKKGKKSVFLMSIRWDGKQF